MKQIILVLMLVSANANATGLLTFNSFEAESSANATSVSKSAGGNGGSGGNVNFESHEHKQPVSSAVAPSVNINEVCPALTVGGHAAQVFGFGVSTTGVQQINAFCAAILMKEYAIARQMLCNSDSSYKKAAKQTGAGCLE